MLASCWHDADGDDDDDDEEEGEGEEEEEEDRSVCLFTYYWKLPGGNHRGEITGGKLPVGNTMFICTCNGVKKSYSQILKFLMRFSEVEVTR